MDETYTTSDLYYAAFLKVAGVPFLGTEWEGRRAFFQFNQGQDSLRELRNQYFNRTAKIPALTYADEIKAMKALTHQ